MAVSSIAVARAVLLQLGVPVSNTAPKALPAKFIRVARAGGARGRELDSPRILVECYASTTAGAPDAPAAEQLALNGHDALRSAASGGPWAGGWVTGWVCNTIADYPDLDQSRHARFQFTGDLYLLT